MSITTKWNRRYRLDIEYKGSIVRQFGYSQAEDGSDIRISFNFEKTDSAEFNQATVNIWNLSIDSIKVLESSGCKCYLSVGYGQNLIQVFQGDITNCVTQLDSGNRKTTINVLDIYLTRTSKNVDVSISSKVSAWSVLDTVASNAGLSVSTSETAKEALNNKYVDSYSTFGTIGDVLSGICSMSGTYWNVQDGCVIITKYGELVRTRNIKEISAETGMIGMPKRIYNSSRQAEESTDKYLDSGYSSELFGYEIRFLLDASIEINDVVLLKSKYIDENVDATFRVYYISCSGDSYSGEWSCTARVMMANVTQPTDYPTNGGD